MSNERDEVLSEAVRLREQDRSEEARALLLDLAERNPLDVEVAYQTAWVHDKLGLEADAVPYYERALATEGLSLEDRAGAFLGLGSTYRTLGRYESAEAIMRHGLEEFPQDKALQTFLAMALYNLGQPRESISILLKLLAATSNNGQIQRYNRAINFYAEDLDATS